MKITEKRVEPLKIGLAMIVSDRPTELNNALASAKGLYDELHVTIVYFKGIDVNKAEHCRMTVEMFGGTTSEYHTPDEWEHPFIDDFGKARNQSCSNFSDDINWIMWLDSDEIIRDSSSLRRKIQDLDVDGSNEILYINMKIAGGSTSQSRVYKKGSTGWKGRIHEVLAHKVEFNDGVGYVLSSLLLSPDEEILHMGVSSEGSNHRNKTILADTIALGTNTWRDDYYYGLHMWAEGERTVAVGFLKDCIERSDNPETLYHSTLFLAQHHLSEEAFDPPYAFELIKKAMDINMNHYKIYIVMADFFRARKLYSTAIQWYRMAMDIPHFESWGNTNFGWLINDVERYGYSLEHMGACYLEIGEVMKAGDCHARARWWNPQLERNDDVFKGLRK